MRSLRATWKTVPVGMMLSVAAVVAMVLPASPIGQGLILFTVIGVPGCAIAARRRRPDPGRSKRLIEVTTFGALCFFAVTFLLGSIPPIIGFHRPLERLPSIIVWTLVLGACSWSDSSGHRDSVRWLFGNTERRQVVWALFLSIVPIIGLIGIVRINLYHQTAIAWISNCSVVILAVVACIATGWRRGPHPALILGVASVTAAFDSVSRGGWFLGWDINHEFAVSSATAASAQFPLPGNTDSYAGMLSITTLPEQARVLSGLNLHTFLMIVPAFALAMTVVVMWFALRRLMGEHITTVALSVVVLGSATFLRELPSVTRQCWALWFFAVILFALVDARQRCSRDTSLLVAASAAMAVTHYSTALLGVGALIFAALANFALRAPRQQRFLTGTVTASIAGFTLLWETFIAKTGTNLRQLQQSISDTGFHFLPGSGSFVSRWLKGAALGQAVPASQIRANDLLLRSTSFRWMHVDPRAIHTALSDTAVPHVAGNKTLGALVQLGSVLLSQGTLAVFLTAVVILGLRAVRTKGDVEFFGLAVFAVLASVFSRISQTLAVQFGPNRVALQMYLLFLVVLGLAMPNLRGFAQVIGAKFHFPVKVATLLSVAFAVAASLQLTNYFFVNSGLPAPVAIAGEQLQRGVSSGDFQAAGWVAAHHGTRHVQTDLYGQLAMLNIGSADSSRFIPSIDPVIVDNNSWIFSSQTNAHLDSARGGSNASYAVFAFPRSYFSRTRSIVFVSTTDEVYGADLVANLSGN